MREWRNWQTRTFEGRVVTPYGFKSRFSHHNDTRKCVVFVLLYEDIFPCEVDGMLKICRSILHCLEGISAFEDEKNKLFMLAEQYEKYKCNKI